VKHQDEGAVIIKYDRGNLSLTFSSLNAESIFQDIRNALQRQEMNQSNSIGGRVIRPSDVPGAVLNMALLNLGSNDQALRLAAYNLLDALSAAFGFSIERQLLSVKGMNIPSNSSAFVRAISKKLAETGSHLTLEFLGECIVGLGKSSKPLKSFCLEYMAPWLTNLDRFIHAGTDNAKDNIAKVREIIQKLIEFTVKESEIYLTVKNFVWTPLGKMDDMIPLILDEFVKYAVKFGFSSQQAEVMANTTVSLSSFNVRGKLIARLRKVIAETSNGPKSSLTKHSSWGEIAVLIRFLLMMSFNDRLNVKQYLPELFHIISLLAATGPSMIRSSVHGIVVNLVQSLCTSLSQGSAQLQYLRMLLSELSEPKSLLLFGLKRADTGAFTRVTETTSESEESMSLSSLESIVHTLLEVVMYGAPDMGK
jgi:hypothetical protein